MSQQHHSGLDPLGLPYLLAGEAPVSTGRAALASRRSSELDTLAREAVEWLERGGHRRGRHQASSDRPSAAPSETLARSLVVLLAHLETDDEVRVSPAIRPVAEAVSFVAAGDAGVGFRASALEPVGTATVACAAARRFVDLHVAPQRGRRSVGVMSADDLDDSVVWEAIADARLGDLGEVVWVVEMTDRARASSDAWERRLAAGGWQHSHADGNDTDSLFAAYDAATAQIDRPSVVFVWPEARAASAPRRLPQPRSQDQAVHGRRERAHRADPLRVPPATGLMPGGSWSAADAFGEVAEALAGDPAVGTRMVTTDQIVGTATRSSELVALTELGLIDAMTREPLIPVGLLDDPMSMADLERLSAAAVAGSRFMLVHDAAGSTGPESADLAEPLGLPGLIRIEPAYAQALDWMVCHAMARVGARFDVWADASPADGTVESSRDGSLDSHVDGSLESPASFIVRLSHRQLDQSEFYAVRERWGVDALRRRILSGAYRLRQGVATQVQLAGAGGVVGDLLEAADLLEEQGIGAHVVEVTSEDALFLARQQSAASARRNGTLPELPEALALAFDTGLPLVVAHHSSASPMRWLGPLLGVASGDVALPRLGDGSDQSALAIADQARRLVSN